MRYALLSLALILFVSGCSPRLKVVEQKQKEISAKIDALGETIISQTVPQVGCMSFPWSMSSILSGQPGVQGDARWIRIDLEQPTPITRVALIPVQMDWRLVRHTSNHFPKRFIIEMADNAEFGNAIVVADFRSTDFPNPGITPVVFDIDHKTARYVRVSVYGEEVFALAEIMVMSGKRNVALGGTVEAVMAANAAPRWGADYLIDGRNPLGPPILNEMLTYDGLFAGPPPDNSDVWIQVDLGRVAALEEVRIHPVHGRHRIDHPGYKFPSYFRVESSKEPDFKESTVLYETAKAYPNPGNNVVTISAKNTQGRFVRMTLGANDAPDGERRFGISEMEVYSGGENIARQATVDSSGDPRPTRKDWPKTLLVDGCTSFGRIIELPQWLDNWVQRKRLNEELESLNQEQVILLGENAQRQAMLSGALCVVFVGGIALLIYNFRRAKKREVELFRKQLAHDLHDEIGSNLAAIGIMSEAVARVAPPAAANHCGRIVQIVKHTTEAMRETLWLAGFKDKIGANLMDLLRGTAARLLPDKAVEWTSAVDLLPEQLLMEERRQILLFFKEALANIVRHSRADTVTLAAKTEGGSFILEIKDNGRGFELQTWSGGVGLESLQSRANRLGGTVQVETAPENGTRIVLRAKLRN